ncbi:hypothetical protein EDB85DRAFT_956423 [Lactarius pseudohatsudake]|nr:hypothetical protein EDB85DRAFT_956423 [Lactarius pseudohatsudake]
MRASDRPPERFASVCTSSVASCDAALTSIAFVSKPSVEPPKAETSVDDVLSKSHQTGGPTRPRTAGIDRAAVSASRHACWSPGIPRPVSRRNRKFGLIRRSREGHTRVHTPTPRQKRAPAIMAPLSSRMHQSTGSSRTPPQGAQLPLARPPVPQEQ